MTRKILESCPTCGGPLEITEVRCLSCQTEVRSRYRPCDFCALSDEQSHFLWIFVTSRGNLSEVEKRLGVSYPTVRSKLDEVIDQLRSRAPQEQPTQPQMAPTPPPAPTVAPGAPEEGRARDRREILEAIARGELAPTEGLARIRQLGGGR